MTQQEIIYELHEEIAKLKRQINCVRDHPEIKPQNCCWTADSILMQEHEKHVKLIESMADREIGLRKKEIDRLETENKDIKTAFSYLNKNKKHLWNKVHTQKRLREDMRERERQKFRKVLDDKWDKIKKEHDGFCKCNMKMHCEFYGITSIKEIFDEVTEYLKPRNALTGTGERDQG